jgi:superfamily II DNA or RNA helicase
MVKISVSETDGQLIGLDNLVVIDALGQELSYGVPGAQYSLPFKTGRWDGRERLLTKQLRFPIGLLGRVCKFLTSFGVEFQIDSSVICPDANIRQGLQPALYPYQVQVLDAALAKKSGTIQIATGGGKSVLIAHIAAALGVATMIYVVSLDLLAQLKATIEKTLGVRVGMIGGGICDIRQITVCSVWTAGLACGEKLSQSDEDDETAHDFWEPSTVERGMIVAAVRSARLVMLDESQFAAANSIRMIMKNSVAAAYRYGFSATPWRTSGDDILLEAAFGEKICSISASELISQGYLVQPKIVFRDIPKPEVKLPRKWPAVKARYIVDNEVRNQILVKNIEKLVQMGRKPLALFRELRHGKILFEMLSESMRVRMVSGMLDLNERMAIKQEFENGQVDLILGSVVYDQGLDLPSLDALILCGGGKSTAKALQRVGRVIRSNPSAGKKDAIVVDTFDQAHFVNNHSLMRHGIYRTEPGYLVKVEAAMEQQLRKTANE